MIKLVALIKRRADLSTEEFQTYYEQRHAPLFQSLLPPEVAAAITRYVQNHAVTLGTTEPAYDCITEFEFDDLQGLRLWSDWYLGDGGRPLREDEPRFMDTSQRVVMVTEVHDLGAGR